MNAKPVLAVAAITLAVGGLTFYFAGGKSAAKTPAAAPTQVPTIVDPKPAKAELTAKEVEPAPAPAPVAAPTEVAPGVKVYPNKFGDLTYDRNTKTLTQNRKMLFRKPDGTVLEREVMVTATPKVSPLDPVKRQLKEGAQKKPRSDGKPAGDAPTGATPPADGTDAPKKPFVK